MVKFFLNLLAFAPLFATLAVASYIQLNYYYDDSCTEFASSPPVVPLDLDGGVYNWEIAGTNSVGIANCEGFGQCTCNLYQDASADRNEPHSTALWTGQRCISGHFRSFFCLAA